jgi:hypothetical protein
MYAGAQKEGLGFDRLVEEVKMRMSRYQVTPNILIVPPQENKPDSNHQCLPLRLQSTFYNPVVLM